MLPSVPGLGQRVNGVKLWVDVGPLRFQPGEIAKIFLVIFLAGYLRDKREALARGRLKDFGPLLAIWGAAMLVLVQTSDLGSALLNFGIFLAMVYAATGRLSYVLAGLVLFAGGAALLYDSLARVQQRVTVWLQPWTDEKVHCSINGLLEYRQNCDSYQLVKSLYSIANGGYGGTGIGRGTFETVDGTPLIPYLQTDFVYSAIAQELGLIGAAAVLLLFLALVARGMRVALVAHDGFSKLLAAGLSFGLALQTFIIVGGVLRLVPLTGITLPFMSTAARASCRTSSCSRSSCSFPTAPCGRLRREPPVDASRMDGDGADRGADRRDDVLADLGAPWPRRTPGQRDPARGGVPGAPRADPRARASARAQPRRQAERQDALLPPLSAGRARRARRRLLDGLRARAGLEKSLNGILTGTERDLASLVNRQLDEARGKPIVGDTVVTTLDLRAQQVALEQLGRTCGAVVALDPRSGKSS